MFIATVEQYFYLYTALGQLSEWACQQCIKEKIIAGVTDSTEERKGGHDMMAGLDEGQTNMFRAARKRQISKTPSVLVVSFQRLGRDHPQVQIEERLDIRPFMI